MQLRRERIAERMKALQELVPSCNKVPPFSSSAWYMKSETDQLADALLNLLQTDRAAMLDEIVDYVKFLRLQVKVLTSKISPSTKIHFLFCLYQYA